MPYIPTTDPTWDDSDNNNSSLHPSVLDPTINGGSPDDPRGNAYYDPNRPIPSLRSPFGAGEIMGDPTTGTPYEHDLSTTPIPDQNTNIEDYLRQKAGPNGFANKFEYQNALINGLKQIAAAHGQDVNDDAHGSQWYAQNLQQGYKEMGKYLPDPINPKDVKELSDGTVIQMSTGKVIRASNPDPTDIAQHLDAMHEAASNIAQRNADLQDQGIQPPHIPLPTAMSNAISRAHKDPAFAASKLGKAALAEEKSQTTKTPELDDQTVSDAAAVYARTGKLPSVGMGKDAAAMKAAILKKWSDDIHNNGTTVEDQQAKQAALHASAKELDRLQSTRGPVMAFAETADKNMDLANQLSLKVDRTGVPVLNRWLNAGKMSISGDPDVAAFHAAVQTAVNEYAKVTSSATGGGTTSDSARKEAEDMLNTAQTPAQFQKVISTLKMDIENRRSGYDDQINSILGDIKGKHTETPPPVPAGMKLQYNKTLGKYKLVPK